MNLVLADTEEFRRVKRKPAKSAAAPGASSSSVPLVETEEKRTLGLTIVRGAHIISLSVESPPPADPSARLGTSAPGGAAAAMAAGPGISRPAGRGLPVGLTVSANRAGSSMITLIIFRVRLLVWEEHHQAWVAFLVARHSLEGEEASKHTSSCGLYANLDIRASIFPWHLPSTSVRRGSACRFCTTTRIQSSGSTRIRTR
jgi:small nuclear ribonucleoprotein B and B'